MSSKEQTAPATEDASAIARLREGIDVIDREIARLIARRACLARDIGRAKGGAPGYRPEREREVIARAVAENRSQGGALSDAALASLYREIVASCRSLEERPTVAYLGPPGTFTEMAVHKQFGSNITQLPCDSVDDVFRAAETERAGYAVVPLENSTQGAVTQTMDLLLTSPLTIIAEVNVPVVHNLLNLSGRVEDVRTVSAHPQALSQCRAWLSGNLAAAPRVPAQSNAEAARAASSDPTLGAIASSRAADLYGLRVAVAGIQDDPRNRTRFLILGRCPPARSGQGVDKTSVVFSVPNRAGFLFRALKPFEAHGVQMVKLESRPARNGAWEYNFFVDVEGHREDPPVAAALAEMKDLALFFKILGSYPMAGDV